jgi:hypothetical protein
MIENILWWIGLSLGLSFLGYYFFLTLTLIVFTVSGLIMSVYYQKEITNNNNYLLGNALGTFVLLILTVLFEFKNFSTDFPLYGRLWYTALFIVSCSVALNKTVKELLLDNELV